MRNFAVVTLFLLMIAEFSGIVSAKKDGVPGRRDGGGTRYSVSTVRSISFGNWT